MEAFCGYIEIDHEETLLASTLFPDLMLYSIGFIKNQKQMVRWFGNYAQK